jgi:hypothetical protein
VVIGGFILARLLGIRLLTLEAQVVVHADDHDGGSAIVVSPASFGPATSQPARPTRGVQLEQPAALDRRAGSDQLARAVQMVEEGAHTLERTRRAQYRR